jgi:hypothetical protein
MPEKGVCGPSGDSPYLATRALCSFPTRAAIVYLSDRLNRGGLATLVAAGDRRVEDVHV